MIGSVRNKINSHEDLLDMYEEADKKPSKKLHLVFINTEVSSRLDTNLALPQKHWTGVGMWQGKNLNGWAGGSVIKNYGGPRPNKPPGASIAGSKFATDSREPPGANIFGRKPDNATRNGATASSAQQPSAVDELTTVKSAIVPFHRTVEPLKSVLLHSSASHQNSVKFKANNEERIYETDRPATDWVVRASKLQDETSLGRAMVPIVIEPPEEAFVNAVQHKTYQELIEVLEAGCACDREVAFSKLNEQYDKVKEALKSVQQGLARNASDSLLNSRMRDLAAKKTILNIYVNACLEVENCSALNSRVSFEIFVRSLLIEKSARVLVRTRSDMTTGDVKIRVDHKNRAHEVEEIHQVSPNTQTFRIWIS
jgi:hypothetical protein